MRTARTWRNVPGTVARCAGAAAGLLACIPAVPSAVAIPPTFEDVPYSTNYARCAIDLFLPWWVTRPTPLVVFFHGGGFNGGTHHSFRYRWEVTAFLPRGIAFASCGYPFLSDTGGGVAESIDYCARAVRFLVSHASEWNIDTNRMALHGVSAGALAADLIAWDPGYRLPVRCVIAEEQPDPAWPLSVLDAADPPVFLYTTFSPTNAAHSSGFAARLAAEAWRLGVASEVWGSPESGLPQLPPGLIWQNAAMAFCFRRWGIPWVNTSVPRVRLVAPRDAAHLTEGDRVTLTAEAADDAYGTVTNVVFLRNGEVLAVAPVARSNPTGAVSWTWTDVPPGEHRIAALAEDNEGGVGTSAVARLFVSAADLDEDGMPDPWERIYFGDTNTIGGGPLDDSDGDGANNRQEYLAGTDPTNAGSRLRAAGHIARGSGPVVGFLAAPGRWYSLERADWLLPPVTGAGDEPPTARVEWSASTFVDVEGVGRWITFTNEFVGTRGFYRVKASLCPRTAAGR